MLRRLGVIGPIAVLALLAATLPAFACSCIVDDPRDTLRDADGAFIGTLLSQRPVDPDEPFGNHIYTFQVDEEIKGEFSDTEEVRSASQESACALAVEEGEQTGLFLYETRGNWHSISCSQTSPRALREAASPLPEPNGVRPTRMILGGSFGRARVMALDKRGRTLDYGFRGDRDVTDLDLCPGGKRFVEISRTYPGRPHFAVRRVSTLAETRDVVLSFGPGRDVIGLHCRNRKASRALVFVTEYGEDGKIYELRKRAMVQLHKNVEARYAVFHGRFAYLSGKNQRLWRLNLKTGASRLLYESERPLSEPELNRDGSYLAVIQDGGWDPNRRARLVLVRLSDGRVRSRRVVREAGNTYAKLEWAGRKRVVFMYAGNGGSRVFDLRLQVLGKFGRWSPDGSGDAVVGNRLYGAYYGRLQKVRLPDGAIKRGRDLPSPVHYDLIAVPPLVV